MFGSSGYDVFNAVQSTPDGGLILVGITESSGPEQEDLWLMKVDLNGDSLWSRTYGGSDRDEGHSIIALDDGYLVCGATESYAHAELADGWVLKVDQNGDSIWGLVFGSDALDGFFEVVQISEEEYVLAGTKSVVDNFANFWALKLSILSSVTDQRKGYFPQEYRLHPNYPNPFNSSTEIEIELAVASNIELKVYNIQGQEITTLVDDIRNAGAYHISWDGKNAGGLSVTSGVYVYQIKTGKFQDAKKMLLLR